MLVPSSALSRPLIDPAPMFASVVPMANEPMFTARATAVAVTVCDGPMKNALTLRVALTLTALMG